MLQIGALSGLACCHFLPCLRTKNVVLAASPADG